jgi:hypothetical protein
VKIDVTWPAGEVQLRGQGRYQVQLGNEREMGGFGVGESVWAQGRSAVVGLTGGLEMALFGGWRWWPALGANSHASFPRRPARRKKVRLRRRGGWRPGDRRSLGVLVKIDVSWPAGEVQLRAQRRYQVQLGNECGVGGFGVGEDVWCAGKNCGCRCGHLPNSLDAPLLAPQRVAATLCATF